MDGLIIHKCQSCDDDANLYCRMCRMHFCPDHACLHLSVAQEQFRYTERSKDENLPIRTSQEQPHIEEQVLVQDLQIPSTQSIDVSVCSEELLRTLYEQSIALARKYRTELERRAAPFARTYFGEALTKTLGRVPKTPKVKQPRGLAKSKVMALEYLQAQIKAGNISAEQIMAKIK